MIPPDAEPTGPNPDYWKQRNRNKFILGVVVAVLAGLVLLVLEECAGVDLGRR